MKRILIALLIIAALVFSVPTSVQDQAGQILGSERNLIRTTTYQITVLKEIVPGMSEIVGRKYLVNLVQSTNGVFLNENGTIWIQDSPPSSNSQIEAAIEQAEPQIVFDMANIDHIKKFTEGASADEVTAYKKYFTTVYGGLYKPIYLNDPTTLAVVQVEQNMVVDPNQSNTTINVNSTTTDIQLGIVNGTNYPISHLGQNVQVQRGDIVYAVILNNTGNGGYGYPTIESTVVKEVSTNTIVVDNTSSQIAALLSQDGQIIGLGNGKKDQVNNSNNILSELNKSNISNLGGSLTGFYLLGVKQFNLGNFDQALKSFDNVLKVDPQNPGAVYYSQKIKSDPIQNYVIGNWQILLIILGIIVAGYLVFKFSSGSGKRRRRYKDDD